MNENESRASSADVFVSKTYCFELHLVLLVDPETVGGDVVQPFIPYKKQLLALKGSFHRIRFRECLEF